MNIYGQIPPHSIEGSQSEWNSPAPETGLEESMWQLGLGGGGGSSGGDPYPERPGEADCVYYMRTGFCGYGARCRYNHPRDRSTVAGVVRTGGGEFPERVGQPVCQYFLKTGTCKYGATCKYHHPRYGGGVENLVSLNYYGYPLRPGEKECSYYVKTGQCKFGVTCKFHHPQPAGISVPAPAPTFYPTVQSPSVPSPQYGMASWQVARPQLVPSSYVQGPYGPMLLSPGVLQVPGWSPYPPLVSPVASPGTQHAVGTSSLYGSTHQLSPSAPAYVGPFSPSSFPAGPSSSTQKEHMFPQRPGQPECQFYMKTGYCKYGSSCRYHHPSERSMPKTTWAGLPLRPNSRFWPSRRAETLAEHYEQTAHPIDTKLRDFKAVPWPTRAKEALSSFGAPSHVRPGPCARAIGLVRCPHTGTISRGHHLALSIRNMVTVSLGCCANSIIQWQH
ncbi:zinc finger CCCH domain-containing protein 58-like isoform X2 [Magnolia sinica]|uniref:zinc finger CCCH domain-containing protein 58-like isoform X2 n=1 Tax=Magnolia sinica TaxID=86752 RepID=UPI00265A6C1E|nr:zinc finger CCCH domain-containing protein 58-like isoform X2 [Magnolia sinica]